MQGLKGYCRDPGFDRNIVQDMENSQNFLSGYRIYRDLTATLEVVIAVFTLEMDYPPETGYLLDNSRQTDNMS